MRRGAGTALQPPQRFQTTVEQIFHRFGVGLVIEPSDKVDGVAADLFVLVIPQISPDRHLCAAVPPFVLFAGALELLALSAQQLGKVGLPRPRLLFFCEMDLV